MGSQRESGEPSDLGASFRREVSEVELQYQSLMRKLAREVERNEMFVGKWRSEAPQEIYDACLAWIEQSRHHQHARGEYLSDGTDPVFDWDAERKWTNDVVLSTQTKFVT